MALYRWLFFHCRYFWRRGRLMSCHRIPGRISISNPMQPKRSISSRLKRFMASLAPWTELFHSPRSLNLNRIRNMFSLSMIWVRYYLKFSRIRRIVRVISNFVILLPRALLPRAPLLFFFTRVVRVFFIENL